MSDPIIPRREDGWVKATGTTLGADNGVGAAAMLAVMEAGGDLVHGPLELLFTVDEESGLNGVMALDPEAIALQGRRLLNLDSEGRGLGDHRLLRRRLRQHLTLPLETAPAPEGTTEPRGEALRPQGRALGDGDPPPAGQRREAPCPSPSSRRSSRRPLHLTAFQGGNKHNALPREAAARVVLPGASRDSLHRRGRAERPCRHSRRDPHRRSGRGGRDHGGRDPGARLDGGRDPQGARPPERLSRTASSP